MATSIVVVLVQAIVACTSDSSEDNSPFSGVIGSGLASGAAMSDAAHSAADVTDLVLITGQSNALGADTSFDENFDRPHERVFAYTREGWRMADLHQVWDLNWFPQTSPETDPSNNFGFHFAKRLVERRADRVVGFILATAPGQGIDHWAVDSEFSGQIRSKVLSAINALPNRTGLDGILWHQGETDWADSLEYSQKLNAVIANFRTESWFGSDKPFICGETVAAPVNRRLMALNSDGDKWTGCVAAAGLPAILDNLHFSAASLRTVGARYADKFLEMIAH